MIPLAGELLVFEGMVRIGDGKTPVESLPSLYCGGRFTMGIISPEGCVRYIDPADLPNFPGWKEYHPYRCNKCHRPMKGTTAYDGACQCGGLIEGVPTDGHYS